MDAFVMDWNSRKFSHPSYKYSLIGVPLLLCFLIIITVSGLGGFLGSKSEDVHFKAPNAVQMNNLMLGRFRRVAEEEIDRKLEEDRKKLNENAISGFAGLEQNSINDYEGGDAESIEQDFELLSNTVRQPEVLPASLKSSPQDLIHILQRNSTVDLDTVEKMQQAANGVIEMDLGDNGHPEKPVTKELTGVEKHIKGALTGVFWLLS